MPDYNFIETADGSPSLRFDDGESMHNIQGAFSETVEIYLPVFEHVLVRLRSFSVISIGFGLGYVESLLAAWSLKTGAEITSLQSFEVEPRLYSDFDGALLDENRPSPVYEEILSRVSSYFDVDKDAIQSRLKSWKDGIWQRHGRLTLETLPASAEAIIYDPFSAKTNGPLWEENFLLAFLQSAAQPFCVFSSYAATGNLTRSLRSEDFQVEKKTGFGGKRERTFAVRGAS